ncbi:MAG: hypothetical protein HC942_05825 [Microcoleus sp. SU_5_6]|nr:hypothetical protein [Microcoleus sp. SU_5_6]
MRDSVCKSLRNYPDALLPLDLRAGNCFVERSVLATESNNQEPIDPGLCSRDPLSFGDRPLHLLTTRLMVATSPTLC